MAVYTETIDTSFNYPHIDIYKTFRDGVQNGYNAYLQEGYVVYSASQDVFTTLDPITGEEITLTNYFRMVGFPLNYNFDNFDHIAVLESEVPADRIVG